jgi:hypothetical protein
MTSFSSLSDQFDSRGFVPGVFRGARSFRIDPDGWLTGIVYRTIWTPGVNTAECRQWLTVAARLPAYWTPPENTLRLPEGHGMDVCRHGFYAYSSASNDYHQDGFVSGVIEGWGKEVMLGSRGFRASKARIVALCVSEVRVTDRDRTALVPQNYPGVPMFNTFEQMVGEYPPEIGEGI